MVLAEADERQSYVIGENRLLDDVAEHRGLRPRLPRLVVRHVTEAIEPEFDLIHPAIISAASLGPSHAAYCTVA
jgi:hypothetical protein